MRYARHDTLVAPARASASLWRLAGGVAVLVGLFVVLGFLWGAVQAALIAPERQAHWDRELYHASTPAAALVNLYVFLLLGGALAVALRLVHARAWVGLFGPPGLALTQFGTVMRALLPLFAVTLLLPTPDALHPTRQMALAPWLMLLPLALPGLLIQTATEELIFRGYLQSQLAARFRHPVVWIGLPTLVFSALHFDPEMDPAAAWLIVLWAGCFGLIAADLTARSGTLGPAIALHLVNNAIAIVLVAPIGSFDGLALYTVALSMSDTALLVRWIPVELMILFCSWLAARLVLRV